MTSDHHQTLLELISLDADVDSQSARDALGSAAHLVDSILTRRGRSCAFMVRTLSDLDGLEARLESDECSLCWELDFETIPSAPLLCSVLGDALKRWPPRILALRTRDSGSDETRRLLFTLRCLLISLERCAPGLRLVSCPTCGRCTVDLIDYAREVDEKLRERTGNLTVAVMGCEVNGPGEAKAADVGIAFGRGVGLIFLKGEKVRKVEAEKAVDALMEEVDLLLS